MLNAIIRVDPDGGRAWISGDAEYQVTIKPGNKACEEQTVQVKVNENNSFRPFPTTC